jgi:hypothetical protein
MKNDLLRRIVGAFVFLVSAIQLISTAQVSVSFWDPGELSAAACLMQVPHPPGGPLFTMVGRLFYMLPVPGSLGFRMNLVSALASAGTVLLLYLIILKVIENFKGKLSDNSIATYGTYFVAAFGALTLSFSDTFWFNAVEANYFSASTFLYTSILWLMLVWNEKADEPGSERYLLLIAYIAGLSGGLHLMSVLTIFIAAFVVVMRKQITDEGQYLASSYVFLGHMALLFVVAAVLWAGEKGTRAPSTEEIAAFETKFKVAMVLASVAIVALFRKKVFQHNSIYIPILIAGVALTIIYPGVIKYVPELLLWVSGDHLAGGLLVLIGLFVAGGITAYWAYKNKHNIIAFSITAALVALLGVTTYILIVIRANDTLPMNENHPSSFAQLVSYLNREQYGDFPLFKRRWSPDPEKAIIYSNYTSDWDFFSKWQMGHMFQRYVGWNFIGRASHDQDAGLDWKGLFGIPFFLGLWGLYYHFRKDWKMASVFVIAFVLMGYLITYYQNQQQPQPRDREYFYCGAYLVFALWIALGVQGLFDLILEKLKRASLTKPALIGTLLLCAVFVPGRMFYNNYPVHDRSKNWIPWDFAYNLLQSCDKDAILFTQGDNDTFPLWYMQDVEGVRRDVRIVNLSLVNTPWYIAEMKAKAAYPEALPVPMGLTDAEIAGIQPIAWEPRGLAIPISPEAISRYQETHSVTLDTSITNNGRISFFLRNTLQFGQTKAIRVQDIAVYDIIVANDWKRPVYFAATCAPDAKIGLDEYLWFKGLVWKLEPQKISQATSGIDAAALEANIMHTPAEYSKIPQTGFRFREIANPKVFFDENTRHIMINYRMAFRALATYDFNIDKNPQKSIAVLERMETIIPQSKVPYGWEMAWEMAGLYYSIGKMDKVKDMAMEIEPECQRLIAAGGVNVNTYYNPYRALIDLYEMTKEYNKSLDVFRKLAVLYPKDPGLQQRIQMLEQLVKQAPSASNGVMK